MSLENTSLEELHVVMKETAMCACDVMVDEPDNKQMIDHYLAVYREYRDELDRRMAKHLQECEGRGQNRS
ncbi:hypothetical protein I6I10_12400 [Corynebacterium glucuronolyticum]|uniref:Uncharacterized protein n=1 Tax=Corynebacterium glucuronolyticum TaxID=39791 RepID=A0A7T4EF39_9CORY|nr:hypothetical protein [Corynebacterium glucuronolyticum]QQB46226.1 hypothetical protein I6I10_12400 [Corynebacterium glucuronolyticum]WKD63016.1 hypothetical protein CGLUCO_03705 [Corynebacterium glucuronolyticum DSM 44120]SMB85689.1 hypothetical protein SAMN05660745_01511 [Corynebacterium glucuronolyticum]